MKDYALAASAVPLVLLADPSFAQSAPPPRSTAQAPVAVERQAPQAQAGALRSADGRSPGTGATQNIDPPPASEDVVVTGYRASLGSAQQIKRNSDSILDAIVAQDIGKLPDNTAAESLARVTGVQVNRYGDEVNGVLVRGLPDVATTYNGREIFTHFLRRSELADFPAGALAGLEVYKSGTADLIEPGLAGLINVRSRRPFDFKGFEIAGGIRGTYNDQRKKYDPLGNILVTGRADTPIGEVGILVNGAYNQGRYRNAVRFGSGFIPDQINPATTILPASVGRNFRFPDSVGVFNESGIRRRPSLNANVQWKPASNLEVYYDFLFQGFRGKRENDFFATSLNGSELLPIDAPPGTPAAGPTLSNIVFVDGKPDQVASLTKTGGLRPELYRNTGANRTNTYQVAGGIKWDVGRAHLSTDLAYTRSSYDDRTWSFDTALAAPTRVDVQFFADKGAAFSLPGFDRTNPANYRWRGYYEALYRARGAGWQWRGDLDLDTDVAALPKVQAGFRYTDRSSSLQEASRYAYTELLGRPLDSLGLGALSLTEDTFRGDTQGFRNWLMPSRAGIAGNAALLRQLSRQALQRLLAVRPNDQGAIDALRAFADEELQPDPLRGFRGEEQTYAFYAQGKYQFDIGSVGLDGVVGVRVVNTVAANFGINTVAAGGVTQQIPVTNRQNYVDILPNASLRIRPTNELQIRFAYTKTRTKPGFDQLNPSLRITQNTSVPDPNATTPRPDATGSAGNADLAPLTSKNYDVSVEWYFSKNGSLSIAGFYRDLFGFVGNYTRLVQDPTYGLLQLSRPENAGAGKIKGVEVGGQTFFDFLPGLLSGFGVQANATYIDGRNRLPATITDEPPLVRIPGVSKWSYNTALFYEKGAVSTRLSYNSRSAFVNFYAQVNPDAEFTGEGTRTVSRLDFSFNYSPVKAVTLTFDVSNILGKPFNNYVDYGVDRSYARDVRDEGRYFGLGARFRL